MTLYKINPLRIQKIPLTIKNYPWPCGSKFRSKLFISTMFFLAPLSPRREITVVLRISKRRRFLIYPTASEYLWPVWYSILLASFLTSLSASPPIPPEVENTNGVKLPFSTSRTLAL